MVTIAITIVIVITIVIFIVSTDFPKHTMKL